MEQSCTHFHTVNVRESSGVIQRCEICGKGKGQAGLWLYPPLEGWRRMGQQTATAVSQQQFRSREEAAWPQNAMRREYILRCEPYIRVMCDVRNMQSVRYQVGERGGLVEVEVLWREDSKKLYDMCQEMIDHIGKQYQPGGG